MRILIVDDSVTFRSVIKAALSGESGIDIVGSAANGKIAMSKLRNEAIDLVILDLEMPEMDGLETLRAISMEKIQVRVLVFASRNSRAYEQVRLALKSGASDVISKPISDSAEGDVQQAIISVKEELLPRLRLIEAGNRLQTKLNGSKDIVNKVNPWEKRDVMKSHPDAVVIASSTGGPMALEKLFESIKIPFKVPVFLVQHMPSPFTKNLADRISEITGFVAQEAIHGEVVRAGKIYVAPATFHMQVVLNSGKVTISLSQGERINYVIPSADPLFESCAKIYGRDLLGIVLTGMGEDGKRGACAVKDMGGCIMIQDQASSVVWGMPGAIYEAGAFDRVVDIDECSRMLSMLCTA